MYWVLVRRVRGGQEIRDKMWQNICLLLRAPTGKGLVASAALHVAAFTWLTVSSDSNLPRRARFSGTPMAVQFTTPARSDAPSEFASDEPAESQELKPREVHVRRSREMPPATFEPLAATIVEANSIPPESISKPEDRLDEQRPEKSPDPLPRQVPVHALASRSAVAVPQNTGTHEPTQPDLSANRPPAYPEIAFRNSWYGTVLLRITVDSEGRVTRVEIERSSGHRVLDDAATSAVRTWRGIPARSNGRAVETEALLPVRFQLN